MHVGSSTRHLSTELLFDEKCTVKKNVSIHFKRWHNTESETKVTFGSKNQTQVKSMLARCKVCRQKPNFCIQTFTFGSTWNFSVFDLGFRNDALNWFANRPAW